MFLLFQALPFNPFPDAIVTRDDDMPATIFDILPTKASESAAPVDFAALDFDAVVEEDKDVMRSGKVEWSDVKSSGFSSCGR